MMLTITDWFSNVIYKIATYLNNNSLGAKVKKGRTGANTTPTGSKSIGRVIIVGAGPGDPGLLTQHAITAINHADIVLVDQLVSDAIVQLIPSSTEIRFVGKRAGRHSMSQACISELMVNFALNGNRVVRLKGGDPSVFARTAEEAEQLQKHNIEFSIVPGITTASAAAASLGIPLTLRGTAQSVRLITARQQQEMAMPDWQALTAALESETLVFYMGARRLKQIIDAMRTAGMAANMPIAMIENVSLPNAQLLLGDAIAIPQLAAQQNFSGPCLIMIGHAIEHRYQVVDLTQNMRMFGALI